MTKEEAQAIGELADRLTRPVMTMMFGIAVCWLALKSITNISADQFVGIVMAVVLFWFGSSRQGAVPPVPPPGTGETPTPPKP